MESADSDELARVLAAPSEEEESALRKYLGVERFEDLRGLAQQPSVAAGPDADTSIKPEERELVETLIHGL
jgi:hypothetical protein